MERRSQEPLDTPSTPRRRRGAVFGLLAATLVVALAAAPAVADLSGVLVYTLRFSGGAERMPFDYDRATPSLTFGTSRDIWTGTGSAAPGSDGLFFSPDGHLVIANWELGEIRKYDPTEIDVLIDGPFSGVFANHMFQHPNVVDAVSTPFTGHIGCTSGTVPCFTIFDHTPLSSPKVCAVPAATGGASSTLQPVSFAHDSLGNVFTVFSDGRAECSFCPADTGIEYGGGGFAAYDFHTTSSGACSGSMTMKVLIDMEIAAAHSMAYDPFLSDPTDGVDPHSDFLVFANSRISQIRVDDPGTPGATAAVVATIDMKTEAVCDSLLTDGFPEFDQGSVTGTGYAIVADEHTGEVALVDYTTTTNGTIYDASETVCLIEDSGKDIDDIAPLSGPGASTFIFTDGFESGDTSAWSLTTP